MQSKKIKLLVEENMIGIHYCNTPYRVNIMSKYMTREFYEKMFLSLTEKNSKLKASMIKSLNEKGKNPLAASLTSHYSQRKFTLLFKPDNAPLVWGQLRSLE